MSKLEQGELEAYLGKSTDILYGVISPEHYKEYIIPLLFFKRISDIYDEETRKALEFSGGDEEYAALAPHSFRIPASAHWTDVRNTTENVGTAINCAFHVIENANQDKLSGVFGAEARWTDKELLPDRVLHNLIEHFSTKSLTMDACPEDEFGQGYEYMIKRFADDAGHTAQEFYTNRTVVHLMTELLKPDSGESIYDPTCGTGGMLISCIAYLKNHQKEWRNVSAFGQETIPFTAAIARMNLFLHGVLDFAVECDDTLINPKFIENGMLIVDYIGIFDNVAQALGFDPDFVNKVIANIEELKNEFPAKMRKCLDYFIGIDRTIEGFEGLMIAQDCLPTNNDKDNFGADYRVLNKLWNAISPDQFLAPYKEDYVWLSNVYESVRPSGGGGSAVWAALGSKTIELINQNMSVTNVKDKEPSYYLEPKIIDVLMQDPVKGTREIAMNLAARFNKHGNDPVFIELGRKLEALKEQHAQQLINATQLLKALLQLAAETVQAEKQLLPDDTTEKGKSALTELFNEVQNNRTPVIVKRIVDDIDGIVRVVRFPGWQKTSKGVQDIQSEILKIIWVQYKIKDRDIIDKAYSYVEQYY